MRDEFEDFPMPVWFKVLSAFINRVGFPIAAFLIMWWMCYQTIPRLTEAMLEMKVTMVGVSKDIESNDTLLMEYMRSDRRRGQ
jgi:hypothetical protein